MSDTTDHLSVLGSIKERRQQIAENLHTDVKVPHWDDDGKAPIYVRYKAVPHPFIERGIRKVENAPKKQRGQVELDTNCDLLIEACIGVYIQIGEGDDGKFSLDESDPEGEWTTFDPTLATTLGLDDRATARDVVKGLFFTDGDIFSHAAEVVEFSGYHTATTNEELRGES